MDEHVWAWYQQRFFASGGSMAEWIHHRANTEPGWRFTSMPFRTNVKVLTVTGMVRMARRAPGGRVVGLRPRGSDLTPAAWGRL